MPESPEVDALAGFLRAHAVGRRITSVDLDEFRSLKTRNRPLRELEGRTVSGVRRFGKHLALDTDGPSLLISFGRAGWARWSDGATEQAEQHDPDGDAGQLHPRHDTTPSHDGVLDGTEPGQDPDGDPEEMPDR